MVERVVVLGGGIGGVTFATELKRRTKDRVAIALVDRREQFLFPPSLPWVAMGTRTPDQVQQRFARLDRHGIQVVRDEVTALDLRSRSVRLTGGNLPYDHLVIALGAELAPSTIPGLAEHGHHMYDLDAAVRLRGAVEAFEGGTVAIGVARVPFRCPAAPYEIALLLDDAFRRRGLRPKVRIEFFTPEGAPLPAAGPENGAKVRALLESREIAYHPKRSLREVVDGRVVFEDGDPLAYDLLVCVPPHRAPRPVVDAGLTDGSGWIPVDPGTLQTDQPGVYAIGDVTAVPTPHGYVPVLPKAGVFAQGQAKVVAHNLAGQLLGRGTPEAWDGYGACFLEVARGKSAFVRGNFLAAPRPELEFREPSAVYHTQKVVLEQYWLRRRL